jgi:hypothetical protein
MSGGYTHAMTTTAPNQPTAANPPAAKKLPYGISNFEALITEGYVYIDKTRISSSYARESSARASSSPCYLVTTT